jgi:hypothetical protein
MLEREREWMHLATQLSAWDVMAFIMEAKGGRQAQNGDHDVVLVVREEHNSRRRNTEKCRSPSSKY